MKSFLIILILCFSGLQNVWGDKNFLKSLRTDAAVIADCARELDIDVHKYDNGINLSKYLENPTNETTCVFACIMRKAFRDQRLSLYEGFVFMTNDAYKKGFNSNEFNKEDVISKIERCHTIEHHECNFFQCVNLFASPVFDLFAYDFVNSLQLV